MGERITKLDGLQIVTTVCKPKGCIYAGSALDGIYSCSLMSDKEVETAFSSGGCTAAAVHHRPKGLVAGVKDLFSPCALVDAGTMQMTGFVPNKNILTPAEHRSAVKNIGPNGQSRVVFQRN